MIDKNSLNRALSALNYRDKVEKKKKKDNKFDDWFVEKAKKSSKSAK